MGIKQINKHDRIIFLEMFVKEILINSSKKFEQLNKIELEKVKKRIFDPVEEEKPVYNEIKIENNNIDIPKINIEKPKIENVEIPKNKILKKRILNIIKKPKKIFKRKILENNFERKNPIHFTKSRKMDRLPSPMPHNELYGIKKIKKLLSDNAIQSIECPGPGKYIVVKRKNQLKITRIIMSQKEILSIIDYYSKEARIPVFDGILKAAVGNIFISVVSSKLVGSKFIITRNTPYSLVGRPKPLPKN